MSDYLEFTVPDSVQIELNTLNPATALAWANQPYWTIEQACALLLGFVPVEEWEQGWQIKKKLLSTHTATINKFLTVRAIKSGQPLPDLMRPSEWMTMAEQYLEVHPAIKAALADDKAIPAKPAIKASTLEIQALVDEQHDDVWQSQHASFMRGKGKGPTQASVAKELNARINQKLGAELKWDTVRRTYMKGKKPPRPE